LPSKKHQRAQSNSVRQQQQGGLRIVGAALDLDKLFFIKGGHHKNNPLRKFKKFEFTQDALLKKFGGLPPDHVTGREKPLVQDINKILANNRAYLLGPVTAETVARAVAALRKLNP
jgi:hypothetical protein